MGDLLPYLFTFLAASDGWGVDLNGRYLRIKVSKWVPLTKSPTLLPTSYLHA